ncbi:MAG: hypothetical protein LBU73_05665 [Helicobacteraceae bacterium]|jgi:hypothetical protein|nr:hypothetical protein [Helicobacteraceae bacterium]
MIALQEATDKHTGSEKEQGVLASIIGKFSVKAAPQAAGVGTGIEVDHVQQSSIGIKTSSGSSSSTGTSFAENAIAKVVAGIVSGDIKTNSDSKSVGEKYSDAVQDAYNKEESYAKSVQKEKAVTDKWQAVSQDGDSISGDMLAKVLNFAQKEGVDPLAVVDRIAKDMANGKFDDTADLLRAASGSSQHYDDARRAILSLGAAMPNVDKSVVRPSIDTVLIRDKKDTDEYGAKGKVPENNKAVETSNIDNKRTTHNAVKFAATNE